MLSFDEVRVVRGGRAVLDGATASVPAGSITVLTGGSGAGKSTLLRLCNRLDVPDAGRVLLDGENVAGLDARRLRRRVGMVFQHPTMLPGTVRDNLQVADPGADDQRCSAALERAALDRGFLARPVADLSGGEAQRAALARTLVTEPEVLLLDEPTTALDGGLRLVFEGSARRLADEGVTLVWVTHDLAQATRVADVVLTLEDGKIRAGRSPRAGDEEAAPPGGCTGEASAGAAHAGQ